MNIPQAIQHGEDAIAGHTGYAPGHPLNPYSSLGLWYYVPNYPIEHKTNTVNEAPINRNAPYFGMSNYADYLRDLRTFGPRLDIYDEPLLDEKGEPIQHTLPWSGWITIQDIHNTFGWGLDLNSYRGRRWYHDDGRTGTFPTGVIWFSDFYGKRPDDPVAPGVWDQQAPGYHDFYTPVHRAISIQRVGGGGGAGAFGDGAAGGQTWAFVGGSPANPGGGGGFLYTDAQTAFWIDREHAGTGGAWGAAGNAANQAGNEGGRVGGIGVLYGYNTGAGGNSAWSVGGAGQTCYIGSGVVAGANGAFGSGGGGGMSNNGYLYGFGDGGGGGGYTADNFGAGVIGGVVNVYVGPGGGGNYGGNGGNGRIYVNWA